MHKMWWESSIIIGHFVKNAIKHSCLTLHCLPSIHIVYCPQMPRKWWEIPIRKQDSEDLKQRVIYQAFTLAKKSTEIAINLDMPVFVVQRVKCTWMEIGHVCRTRQFLGRHPLLSPNEVVVSIPMHILWFLPSDIPLNFIYYVVHVGLDWALTRYLPWWNPGAVTGSAWYQNNPWFYLKNPQKVGNVFKEGEFLSLLQLVAPHATSTWIFSCLEQLLRDVRKPDENLLWMWGNTLQNILLQLMKRL